MRTYFRRHVVLLAAIILVVGMTTAVAAPKGATVATLQDLLDLEAKVDALAGRVADLDDTEAIATLEARVTALEGATGEPSPADPDPQPAPDPEPAPDPQPAPDPEPEPDPQPAPDPEPEPEPQGPILPADPEQVTLGGESFAIAGVDRSRGTDELILYTPQHGAATGTNEYGAEVAVAGGIITEVRDRQWLTTKLPAMDIPSDGYVLSGHGLARTFLLANADVGGRVTFSDAPALAPAPSTPDGGVQTAGLPSKVVAGYWPSWSSTRLNTVSSNYNTIFLAFATGSQNNTGTGAVTYNPRFSDAQMKADIAELRSGGTAIILSVGGEGGYTHLDSTSRRQAFLDSIISINDAIGPLDGLDWNFETNWIAAPYRTAIVGEVRENIIWVSQQLKARYGEDFAITKPPSPGSTHDRDWIAAMHAAGVIDLVMPQWYDGGQGSANVGNIDWWASAMGGDHSKVGIGIRTDVGYSNNGASPNGTGSYTQIQTLWNDLSAARPGLRGAFVWHTGIDAQERYWFANTMGPLIEN